MGSGQHQTSTDAESRTRNRPQLPKGDEQKESPKPQGSENRQPVNLCYCFDASANSLAPLKRHQLQGQARLLDWQQLAPIRDVRGYQGYLANRTRGPVISKRGRSVRGEAAVGTSGRMNWPRLLIPNSSTNPSLDSVRGFPIQPGWETAVALVGPSCALLCQPPTVESESRTEPEYPIVQPGVTRFGAGSRSLVRKPPGIPTAYLPKDEV